MGHKHIEFYCPICLGWVGNNAIRVLPCGHTYCVECVSSIASSRKHLCPICRVGFSPRKIPTLYCDVRDKRTRTLLKVTRSESAPTIDLTDPPSSSRAGTPTQHADNEEEEDNPRSYPAFVHAHAGRCANEVEVLDRNATDSRVKEVGVEVRTVAEGIDAAPGDNVQILLKTLAKFMIDVAAPLFAEVLKNNKTIHAAEEEKRRLTLELVSAKRNHKKLKEEHDARQKMLDKALNTAGKAARENKELRISVQELQEAVACHQDIGSQLTEARDKIKRLEEYNQRRAKNEDTMRRKVTKLEEELREVQRRLESNSVSRRSPSPELVIIPSDREYDHYQTFQARRSADLSSEPAESVLPSPSMGSNTSNKRTPAQSLFGSDWTIERKPPTKQKRPNDSKGLPFKFTSDGRPAVPLQLGPRVKLNKHN